jgi:hypothetical protein
MGFAVDLQAVKCAGNPLRHRYPLKSPEAIATGILSISKLVQTNSANAGKPFTERPVRVEFQFRQELGSEISRCNVAAMHMTQV